MAAIENSLFDIRNMDALASGRTWIHGLDPRAKLITTLLFIMMVVSFEKYEISRIIPFFIFPVVMVMASGLPAPYLIKKILLVSPFAVLIGIFNPVLDTEPMIFIGSFSLSGGWVSFISILIRFALTVGSALILICLTGFNGVCLGLEKLRVPGPFVIQLLFLYRYLFVLIEEASRMIRARSLRSFHSGRMRFGVFVPLLGQLLLRTLDRAQRIHLAMCCRGFDGHIRVLRPMRFAAKDLFFIFSWSFLFFLARFYNLPLILGNFFQRSLI